MKVVYYSPEIPQVWSTDRYQHALAVVQYASNSVIISDNECPYEIKNNANSTYKLREENKLKKAFNVAKIAEQEVGQKGLFVAVGHKYRGAIAGVIAKFKGINWIPDIFETPAMPRLNKPYSIHQLTSRITPLMLDTAEKGIHSFHPSTPFQYGHKKTFIKNGSPIEKIEPLYDVGDPIRIVLVGSNPRLERGGKYMLQALYSIDRKNIRVDICGKTSEKMKSLSVSLGLSNYVNFHGWTAHSDALNYVRKATIGYAVLPPRVDWRYAPPIKVGEYLAAGTIPLVSDFPGSRHMAGNSGKYTSPSSSAVRKALLKILRTEPAELQSQQKAARKRGEQISWTSVRRDFAKEIGIDI